MLASCSSLLYMLRILRSHGIPATSLKDAFRATVMAKLIHCSPAWSGYCCSAEDRRRLGAFLRKRLGYCEQDTPTMTELFSDADENFFAHNPNHFLQPFLQERCIPAYLQRSRTHNKILVDKIGDLNERGFIIQLESVQLRRHLQLQGHSDFAPVDLACYQHFLFFVRKYCVLGSSVWQPQMQVIW